MTDDTRLLPLDAMPAAALNAVEFLLFDVDETLTTHGTLTPQAYASLFALVAGGITPVPVTGRPSGWGNVMLSTWPIRGCVTENGGVIAWKDAAGLAQQRIIHNEHRGPGYLEKLRALGVSIAQQFPEVQVSADQPYRLTDLAIDYAEQVPRAPEPTVAAIKAMMRDAGYQVAASSIHIHAFHPANEKANGVYPLMQAAFGLDADAVRQRCAFIGDSPNDASLFAQIPLSVGVANVRASLDKIDRPPAYVCKRECGAGFIEFAQKLLQTRRKDDFSINAILDMGL